jgi:hypothetical protein
MDLFDGEDEKPDPMDEDSKQKKYFMTTFISYQAAS